MWISLSLLSAFGQALAWALKKKTLEVPGINNTIGIVAYLAAGLVLFMAYGAVNGAVMPPVSERFVSSVLLIIFLNVLASWCAYRALDLAPLSMLMPFVALSSLGLVPVEYVVRGVLPNAMQIIGITSLVVGAIIFSARHFGKIPTKALAYFSVTITCYAIGPAFMAVAVDESGSALFSAALFHLGISIGFVPLALLARETKTVQALRREGHLVRIMLLVVLTGIVIAVFENGPNTLAMAYAKASEVMAVKRTMPFFALILGIIMFHERVNRRHVVGTFFLVAGAMLIVWFK